MLLKAFNFICGSVTISVNGMYIERFLNICAANDIAFWDIERLSCDSIRATVKIDGFRKLYKYARRAMCHVHIIKKTGLPFFTYKFKSRYALLGGLAACAALMFVLSGYVWTVEIKGCEKTSPSDILKCLEDNGFYIGMKAKNIDPDALRMSVMTQMEDILWLTVNNSGSHAEVLVTERDKAPVMKDDKKFSSIFAKRDGVIVEILAKDGIARVITGQTVAQGDLLISGKYESQLTGVRLTRADGSVYARTWYNITQFMPLPSAEKTKTGKVKKKHSIIIGSNRFNLYFDGGSPFEKYEKTVTSKRLYAGPKLILPIRFVTQSFYECDLCDEDANYGRAESLLSDALKNKLEMILGDDGEIIANEFSVSLENGVYKATLNAECTENIAFEAQIEDENIRQVHTQ